jgi:hypothetical protein
MKEALLHGVRGALDLAPLHRLDGTPMAHSDYQPKLDQKLSLRWEQAHNLKVVGSKSYPRNQFSF